MLPDDFFEDSAAVDPQPAEIRESCLFVSLLTVPDLSRFPVPAEFTQDKKPIDLESAATWSLGQLRAKISPDLPDEQLQALWDMEHRREKQRTGVLKSLRKERERRGGGYEGWVQRHSRNLLTCRIVAIAVAEDMGDVHAVSCITHDDEADALRFLQTQVCAEFSAWNPLWVRNLIGIRSLALINDGFKSCGLIRPCAVEAESVLELAGAFNVPAHVERTSCEVFHTVAERHSGLLEKWAGEQLRTERHVISTSWRI